MTLSSMSYFSKLIKYEKEVIGSSNLYQSDRNTAAGGSHLASEVGGRGGKQPCGTEPMLCCSCTKHPLLENTFAFRITSLY